MERPESTAAMGEFRDIPLPMPKAGEFTYAAA